jgi:hypothetical protein
VTNSSAEWLERNADRILARQRAQVDTAKLLATFATAVAAALVAAGLQVHAAVALDVASAILLGISFSAAIVVILLDRLREADPTAVLERGQVHQWTEAQIVGELRLLMLAAVRNNAWYVTAVMIAVIIQVVVAAGSAGLAISSLLHAPRLHT